MKTIVETEKDIVESELTKIAPPLSFASLFIKLIFESVTVITEAEIAPP
jgi:hypothetical protein